MEKEIIKKLNQLPSSIENEGKIYELSIHKIEVGGCDRYVASYRNGNDVLKMRHSGLSYVYDLTISSMSISFEEVVENLWCFLDDFNLLKNE